MPTCKFCNQENLDWYENQGRWKLGIKIDINNFRPHKCSPPQDDKNTNNKRNWVAFTCEGCGEETRQNLKLVKSDSLCIGSKLTY
jgi:hypothetical protein